MIEELLEALDNYTEAKAAYNEAAKDVDFDREYWLHGQYETLEQAKKEVEQALNAYIDARIQLTLPDTK